MRTLGIAFALAAAAASAVPAGGPALYGLTRVRNSASCSGAVSGCAQLVSIDMSTGVLKNIGHGHTPLSGNNDLGVVVGDLYYLLGDGWNGTGTVLTGISTKDGSESCRAFLPSLAEVGLVGGGQSLLHDTKNKRLLLAGLNQSSTGVVTHFLLSAPVGGCGPFTKLGEFGDGDYEPMAHGSGLDVEGQRVFDTLSTGPHGYGMGVISVGSVNLSAVYTMSASQQLWGPNYLSSSKKVVGPMQANAGPGIEWRTLDPDTGAWTNAPLKYAPSLGNVSFPGLLGNLGSVRAFDPEAEVVYTLAGRGNPSFPTTEVVQIDAKTGTLTAHSGKLSGDVGWSGSIIEQLAVAA